RPSADDDVLVAHVGGEDDAIRPACCDLLEPPRLPDRACAEHDGRSAVSDQSGCALGRAHATADLNGCAARNVDDPADVLRIVADTERSIEIDDVERWKTAFDPVACDGGRIRQTHAFVVRLTADELHHASRTEIDRGMHDHRRTCARKLRSTRSPGSPLFSGWNCTPQTLSRRTAAGKCSRPYRLHAITSDSSSGCAT